MSTTILNFFQVSEWIKKMKKNKKNACNLFKAVIVYHLSAAQKSLQELRKPKRNAGMAELADAYGSGPYGSNTMRVQVSFPALFFVKTPELFLRCFFIRQESSFPVE